MNEWKMKMDCEYLNEMDMEKEKIEDCESENGVEQVVMYDDDDDEDEDDNGGYNKDMPPADDVCPICFDRFTVPCRSNCGHWFCANCIMQFWTYRSSIQPCKCPMCCCLIVDLKPQSGQLIQPPAENIEVLKKVQHYNRLYVNGVHHGMYLNVIALPLLMRRLSRFLIDPDGLRCIYYVMRLLGLLLAVLYEKWEFEFIPTGGLGIQRSFDMCASVLMPTLFLVGVGYRWVLKFRARRLAGSY